MSSTLNELPSALRVYLLRLSLIAIVSYLSVVFLIPIVSRHLPAKLSGKDLCKRGTPAGDIPIPEALGIVSGLVYVASLIVTLFTVVDDPDVKRMMAWGIVSILSMILLGFADDLADLRWRHKLLFPPLASLPLLINYPGLTAVVLPKPVRFLFEQDTMLHSVLTPVITLSEGGELAELGLFYYLYMGMMAVFCTNAINIYAGVNGLEAGQSFVIGAAVVVQNVYQILLGHDNENFHYLSLMFMVPYLATTLGLLKHNWYPSRVFVGDTFCYYAGITFAVCGILGHFSKTLLLFFLPQVLNFLYSIPQLFKIVPCPRHRLPKFNAKTGLLEPSTITPDSTRSNYTIINLFLVVFGPMKENHLVVALLAFQALCCGLAFYIRYGISGYFYDFVQ
uniref:UDP-N-acetylglucosamine--dolichyl-phosphate N-acetylglucosaminephosphotransferase n=1 Tax=Peronospora matthiolae TaxID=2874970 RepID=A0AAV1UB98_9STRA